MRDLCVIQCNMDNIFLFLPYRGSERYVHCAGVVSDVRSTPSKEIVLMFSLRLFAAWIENHPLSAGIVLSGVSMGFLESLSTVSIQII